MGRKNWELIPRTQKMKATHFLLCVISLIVSASCKPITIPITQIGKMESLRRKEWGVVGNVFVGSPPQGPFKVQIDTGSSTLWLPNSSCTTCNGTGYKPEIYNPAGSTTAKNVTCFNPPGGGSCKVCKLQATKAKWTCKIDPCVEDYPPPCQYDLLYGDDIGVLGTYWTDRVTLGTLSANTPVLAVGLEKPAGAFAPYKFDGILGLGKGRNSWPTTLQDILGKNNLPNIFGLYLGMVGDDNGVITLGGVDDQYHACDLQYFPDTLPISDKYLMGIYKFGWEDDIVNKNPCDLVTAEAALYVDVFGSMLDSGSTFGSLPYRVWEPLVDAACTRIDTIPSKTAQQFWNLIFCEQKQPPQSQWQSKLTGNIALNSNIWPRMKWHIRNTKGDKDIVIITTAEHYIQPIEGKYQFTFRKEFPIAFEHPVGMILGDAFMSGYYWVFNTDTHQYGVAPRTKGQWNTTCADYSQNVYVVPNTPMEEYWCTLTYQQKPLKPLRPPFVAFPPGKPTQQPPINIELCEALPLVNQPIAIPQVDTNKVIIDQKYYTHDECDEDSPRQDKSKVAYIWYYSPPDPKGSIDLSPYDTNTHAAVLWTGHGCTDARLVGCFNRATNYSMDLPIWTTDPPGTRYWIGIPITGHNGYLSLKYGGALPPTPPPSPPPPTAPMPTPPSAPLPPTPYSAFEMCGSHTFPTQEWHIPTRDSTQFAKYTHSDWCNPASTKKVLYEYYRTPKDIRGTIIVIPNTTNTLGVAIFDGTCNDPVLLECMSVGVAEDARVRNAFVAFPVSAGNSFPTVVFQPYKLPPSSVPIPIGPAAPAGPIGPCFGAVNGAWCSDGNPLTYVDSCVFGKCVGNSSIAPAPLQCKCNTKKPDGFNRFGPACKLPATGQLLQTFQTKMGVNLTTEFGGQNKWHWTSGSTLIADTDKWLCDLQA